eukprot:c21007_g1_i1 orf=388-834(+)
MQRLTFLNHVDLVTRTFGAQILPTSQKRSLAVYTTITTQQHQKTSHQNAHKTLVCHPTRLKHGLESGGADGRNNNLFNTDKQVIYEPQYTNPNQQKPIQMIVQCQQSLSYLSNPNTKSAKTCTDDSSMPTIALQPFQSKYQISKNQYR